MSIPLTSGAVSRIYNNVTGEKPYVQLLEIKRIGSQAGNVERFRMVVSDGQHYQQAMLATQLNYLVNENKIRDSCIVQLEEYLCNVISNRKIIIILKLSVVSDGNGQTIGTPQNIDVAAGSAIASKPVAGAPIQTRPTPTPQPSYQPSRGPTMMTDTPQHFHPISTLNPYQSKWTIKARVTNKSDLRTWHNEKSQGKLFSVDLLDGSGGQIKATMFNEAADKWFPMFQQDNVYVISKGTLKLANKKFNRIPNEYELTLGADAEIQHYGDDDSIQQQKFDFRKIANIQDVETDAHIDVMGIVTSIQPPTKITAKQSKKELTKRTITLVDDSQTQVELTLWGDQAEKYNERELANNPVLVVKSCRVGDFQGRNLSTSFTSQIYVNPPYNEAQYLRDWWEQQGSHGQAFTSISGIRTATGRTDERITFADIATQRKGMGDKPDYFSVRGTVTFFRQADDRPPWYPACANPHPDGSYGCKGKKMTGDEIQGFSCPSCNSNQYTYRYILSLLVCDATGAQWLTAFNETAEKLLGGVAASTLAQYKQQNPAEYEAVFVRANFKPYIFRLRAKNEQTQDESRVRCHIMEVRDVDYVQETTRLMEHIKLYESS